MELNDLRMRKIMEDGVKLGKKKNRWKKKMDKLIYGERKNIKIIDM